MSYLYKYILRITGIVMLIGSILGGFGLDGIMSRAYNTSSNPFFIIGGVVVGIASSSVMFCIASIASHVEDIDDNVIDVYNKLEKMEKRNKEKQHKVKAADYE